MCGKLVLAETFNQFQELKDLCDQNEHLHKMKLTIDQAKKIDACIKDKGYQALFLPNAGLLDSYLLMEKMKEELKEINGYCEIMEDEELAQ